MYLVVKQAKGDVMWTCENGHANKLPTVVIKITAPMICGRCIMAKLAERQAKNKE